MEKDIEAFGKNWEVFKRNNLAPAKAHLAKSITIKGIFDKIGIDLVFGIPISEKVFSGIKYLTEFLTKFLFSLSIKIKSAKEISNILWEFICTIGSPRIFMSDQGTEFNNLKVENLIKRIGSEHILTAYQARTNGQVDRLNKEIVVSLRKHWK